MAKTIGELYPLKPISDLVIGERHYPLPYDDTVPDPDLYVGLELEIENWRGVHHIDNRWAIKTDGSLRGEARELVTLPTKVKFVERLLKDAYAIYQVEETDFSDRCSVHVHMNVLDYTMDQLKVLCILYQMMERLLYDFIGNDRKDNIFCVPWYESGMSHAFLDNSKSSMSNWEKYTALNLLPVQAQGTVEFRHMHGTCDIPYIMQWVRLLSRMSIFAKKTTVKLLSQTVLSMNTVSNYDQFLMEVFADDVGALKKNPEYQELLSIGVVDAKLMFLSPQKGMKREAPPRRPAPARGAGVDIINAALRRAVAHHHAANFAGIDPPPIDMGEVGAYFGFTRVDFRLIKDSMVRNGWTWDQEAEHFWYHDMDGGDRRTMEVVEAGRILGYRNHLVPAEQF